MSLLLKDMGPRQDLKGRLTCDYDGCTKQYIPRAWSTDYAEIRTLARRQGWKASGSHKDLCPGHSSLADKPFLSKTNV